MNILGNMSQPMSVLTSHKSVEWCTPRDWVDLFRIILGGTINLDPASCNYAQSYIQADEYWTEGGLEKEWRAGTVFCNPPYGKTGLGSNQGLWAQKMWNEYDKGHFHQGILLINSTHGYNWYEWLWREVPVCLLRGRMRFVRSNGTVGGQAKRGQTIAYFGPSPPTEFSRILRPYGRVILPDPEN